ncbi:nitroreductase family deazaflavin-dependent oxidoreductase [Mycobacterium sp. Aquia_213]|uniref:nitroreductase family deazaflavin-dependent oxidoreductase n=1 Tax=Mycobacterium sp. Aquia_213 TaxID=2991728 RepID=UPI00226EA417|nr:nitroreductase family deazaflavin-dependent oxidoreductase [Mycobacterium sp. Aquia_213]WAC93358.1 nitroreductase family deazaflavin-dependent oxidoreductase [Mycobacterium sp. Aquia_213]
MAFRRESPLRGRRLRIDEALFERFAMSRAGDFLSLHIMPRIDKVLIPRTNGRLSAMGVDKVGLVTAIGAKSGQPRTLPLSLIDDEDGLLAIGSNYGRPTHPAWSANLLANPECTIEFRGPPAAYRAEVLSGQARADAWATAVDSYPGYANYRTLCAPREIRVFRLRPFDG